MLRWILSCFLAMSVLLTSCTNAGGVSASASPTASESQSATASPTANSKPTAIATIPTSPKPSANPENSLEAALARFVQLKGSATVELKLKSGTVKIEPGWRSPWRWYG